MSKKNVLTRSKKIKAENLLERNQLAEARALCAQVCQADRSDAEAWTLLGIVERKLGRHAEAEQAARRAVAMRPHFAFAHQILGTALQCQGQYADAMDCYREASRLDPNNAECHYLLGNALRETGALQEADRCYQRAIELRPNFIEALSNRGASLIALNRIEEAKQCLLKANDIQPGLPQILCNIATIMQAEGRFDEAKACCRDALLRDANFIDAIALLAELHEKSHQEEDAKTYALRGLALAPDNIVLNLAMARIERRAGAVDDAIRRLERLRGLAPDALLADVLLLLGQMYDKRKDAARAFPCLSEGNRLKARMLPPDQDDQDHYLKRIESVRARFRADPPASWRPLNDDLVDAPVFLIGFPRSGTTLLEQILDSHPQLQAIEEKPTVAAMEQEFRRITTGRARPYGDLTREEIQQLRKAYFDTVQQHLRRLPGHTLIDKMPLNTVQVALIQRIFPKAKFILAIRHPCDACFSCFMQNFALNEAMSTFFSLEKTAEAYAGVMSLWQEYLAALPIDYHRIRYEDLVADKAGETQRLLNFLGLEWNDNVLRHDEHARKRNITTPSYHQVTQPIYQDAKYRWKRYEAYLQPILPVLQPYIEYFGYGENQTDAIAN